jgi:hypothetical protein
MDALVRFPDGRKFSKASCEAMANLKSFHNQLHELEKERQLRNVYLGRDPAGGVGSGSSGLSTTPKGSR